MIGLPKMPACNVVPSKPSELILVISNATITAGMEYTFSIGVLNPGEQPAKEDNFWALTLKNRNGAVIDSNRGVKGLQLKSFNAEIMGFGWSQVLPTKTSRIRFDIYFSTPVEPRTLGEVQIISPDGVMMSASCETQSAFVSPTSFPTQEPCAFTAAGNRLRMKVDTTKVIEVVPEPGYAIMFDVKNPSQLGGVGRDNTWSVALIYEKDILLSHTERGYLFNEPSPIPISAPLSLSTAEPRNLLYAAGALLLLA